MIKRYNVYTVTVILSLSIAVDILETKDPLQNVQGIVKEGVQSSPSPFEISVDKKWIKSGENVSVTISGKDNDVTFKGFLIYAVNATNLTVGNFEPSKDIVLVNSAFTKNGAARQVNFSEKTKVQLKWLSPVGFSGPIKFLMTIVKTWNEIWVAQLSEEIKII